MALALVVLSGGFGLSYLLRKKSVHLVSSDNEPDRRRQRLLTEIAQLDNDFEDNKIPEEHYSRLRTEKKAQLVALMQKSKEESGNR